ncbi:MAG TPA: phospholipid carrier-dependent glycosyltransferase [Anaerolineales bacterium]|jgi:4-amino-4-deoxy-L-arabinose transferase-like glycosyltransferase|nr:phospholipid carrier-dependent glycosyltransferase [Anaerolineales bacterium]
MTEITKPQVLREEIAAPTGSEHAEAQREGPLPALILSSLAIIVFSIGFGVVAWRLDKAPDIFTDEIIYTRIGIRVSGEGAIVWDSGEPFLVHPPLYFLVQGAYFWLVGDSNIPQYAPGNIFAAVHRARYLNAFFAGLTAIMLFLLGRRLRGTWLGLLLVTLFILDPFGVRINRRAMLESLAVLLSLAGMMLLLNAAKRSDSSNPLNTWRLRAQTIAAGFLLGLGMLTKELAFIAVVAVFLFGLWETWRNLREKGPADPHLLSPFVAAGIAAVTYTLYPLWVLASGNWDQFVGEKFLALERLLGLVQITGWNRPDVSLFEFLSQRLLDYGSSYLVLALGGVATVWLLLIHRQRRAGRFLGTWGAVIYPFFGFVALFGSGNDQFFYFLLIPAVVLTGYAFTLPLAPIGSSQRLHRLGPVWTALFKAALILFLVVILAYNMAQWWSHFGAGTDDGYQQLANFVQEKLPVGEPLNASGDPIKFRYFLPGRSITVAATPQEAVDSGVHYFALAPKDVWAHYGRIKPELAAWIQSKGRLLFTATGDSYGEIHLYRVDYHRADVSVTAAIPGGNFHWRSFAPAKGGFIGPLALSLVLWLAFLAGISTVMLVAAGPKTSLLSYQIPALPETNHKHPIKGAVHERD